ncbi:MAG: hypothetical protein NZ844_04510, partial [Chloroherpetonaceae bacterium]|nr:hypothetical protein [Chloroherpetonaceae bacterium]
ALALGIAVGWSAKNPALFLIRTATYTVRPHCLKKRIFGSFSMHNYGDANTGRKMGCDCI